MRQPIDPEIIAETAAMLMDWIPLSEARAARWAVDLLESSPSREPVDSTLERINDAAKAAARNSRDVRYFDVFSALRSMVRREFEAREQARQDLARAALPAVTDGGRAARIAIGVYGDIAIKLIPVDAHDAEYELRRSMSDMEIEEHRAELMRGTRKAEAS